MEGLKLTLRFCYLARQSISESNGRGHAHAGRMILPSQASRCLKVLLVQSRRLPGWALPVAGGTLAVVVGVLWCTSALWYYNGFQLPGP
jgi:uncharacterized protein DUF6529